MLDNTANQNQSKQSSLVKTSTHETGRMSSLEIAELTGRQHAMVMRSIRNMESSWEKVSGCKFALASYKDEQGKERPCYQLTKKECLYISTKFNDEARAKLVIRWESLETGKATPIYQQPKQLTMKEKMQAATWAAKFLNLNDASKLLMAQQILAPTGLILPEYTSSKGFLLCADKLLKKNDIPMSSHAFNLKMQENGFLDYRERHSKSKGVKRFPILIKKGLEYGENQVHPKNQAETQIRYYDDKFPELLQTLKLK